MTSVHTVSRRRMPSRSRSIMSLKSWPAENTGPAAARITARTPGASAARAVAAPMSRSIDSDSEFRRSGRLSVTVARSPVTSTRTCSVVMATI